MSGTNVVKKYLFADEAGNFDFRRAPGASRYFILTSVTLGECSIGNDILALRRDLAWTGAYRQQFHATDDPPGVRRRVFGTMKAYPFRVDVSVFEKARIDPRYHGDAAGFYGLAWFLHMRYVAPRIAAPGDRVLVVGASLGTKAMRNSFLSAVQSVGRKVPSRPNMRAAFLPSSCEPCLQVADYCCWAIQRQWESGDATAYNLIKSKIGSEREYFGDQATHY